jgi:hypothetical protein
VTPAQNLQSMINGRLAQIDQLEAEVVIMRKLLRELGGPKPNGHPGGGRKRDEERHAKLIGVLRARVASGGASVAEMSEASGYGLSSMQTKIKKMFKAGEVERVAKGRYRMARVLQPGEGGKARE